MKTETEFLEKAVINLTIENATVKEELKESKSSSDYWYDAYKKKEAELEKLKDKLISEAV